MAKTDKFESSENNSDLQEAFEAPTYHPEVFAEEPVQIQEILEKKFNYRLVVVNAFGKYMRGNVIKNDEEIEDVIKKGKVRNCSKVAQ